MKQNLKYQASIPIEQFKVDFFFKNEEADKHEGRGGFMIDTEIAF